MSTRELVALVTVCAAVVTVLIVLTTTLAGVGARNREKTVNLTHQCVDSGGTSLYDSGGKLVCLRLSSPGQR